ncbi:hypothetical protein ACLOJK_040421 [Asimina triloba]
MLPSGAKILVGLPMDLQASAELLSWAIGVAAQPNDTVVALHILGISSLVFLVGSKRIILLGKDVKKNDSSTIDITKMRRAKAFVISILGDYAKLCQSKKVNLEARVRRCSNIGKGLVEEAATLDAACLVIGARSKNRAQRIRGLPKQDPDSKSIPNSVVLPDWTGFHHMKRSNPSAQKRHTSTKIKGEKKTLCLQNLPAESFSDDKQSPKTVLGGPEHGVEKRSFNPGDFGTVESESASSKFRSMGKAFLSFFRSAINEGAATEKENQSSTADDENQHPSLRCFSYAEISHATNNFHPDNMVGKGGYAEVYKGSLYDGQTIAVKRLARGSTDQHKEKEFLSELGIIRHICHPNTTYLIGCCIENGLHLVLNFSPNGTLASALHGKDIEPLEWAVRYKIVHGVASGLHYLHKCCRRRIIHRDIKPSNVLLGPDFEPQHMNALKYLAPEYFMHGFVDEKTDVFSFGVLLLEIITGRLPIDCSKQNLLSWAKPLIEAGEIAKLADPKLGGKYNRDQMRRLALTASYCVRYTPIWRPSMSEVLQLITDADNSKITLSWRTSEYNADELDDYSMDFDYQYQTSHNLEDLL